MLTVLASIIMAFANYDRIKEDRVAVLQDVGYSNCIIGTTFLLEILTGFILLIYKLIKRKK